MGGTFSRHEESSLNVIFTPAGWSLDKYLLNAWQGVFSIITANIGIDWHFSPTKNSHRFAFDSVFNNFALCFSLGFVLAQEDLAHAEYSVQPQTHFLGDWFKE